MNVVERIRQRINQMLAPKVSDSDERRRFEQRERDIRARLEALRIEADVVTARNRPAEWDHQ